MDRVIKKNSKKKQKIGVIFDEDERKDYLKSFYNKNKQKKELGK
jgi:hypothetical protein